MCLSHVEWLPSKGKNNNKYRIDEFPLGVRGKITSKRVFQEERFRQ